MAKNNQPMMEISRTLRGVTERYGLTPRLLATEEARILDPMIAICNGIWKTSAIDCWWQITAC